MITRHDCHHIPAFIGANIRQFAMDIVADYRLLRCICQPAICQQIAIGCWDRDCMLPATTRTPDLICVRPHGTNHCMGIHARALKRHSGCSIHSLISDLLNSTQHSSIRAASAERHLQAPHSEAASMGIHAHALKHVFAVVQHTSFYAYGS